MGGVVLRREALTEIQQRVGRRVRIGSIVGWIKDGVLPNVERDADGHLLFSRAVIDRIVVLAQARQTRQPQPAPHPDLCDEVELETIARAAGVHVSVTEIRRLAITGVLIVRGRQPRSRRRVFRRREAMATLRDYKRIASGTDPDSQVNRD